MTLKDYLARMKITAEEFAEQCGVSGATLSRAQAGETSLRTARAIYRESGHKVNLIVTLEAEDAAS